MRLIALILAVWVAPGIAADLVRVSTSPNAKALPIHVGLEKGIFVRHGLDVRVFFTENSEKRRAGLASGAFEIAHSAAENVVVMVENAQQDAVIVAGGDSGMNELFVQPHIRSLADLRGKTLLVNRPDTPYARLAERMLLKRGLREGRDYTVKPVGDSELRLKAMAQSRENTAALLSLPFSIQAEYRGLKSFGSPVELLGPYQGRGAFVRRSWARANGPLLARYLAAYVESLRWSLAPGHREESVAILMDRLKLSNDIADRTLRALADPSRGFTPDAAFDMQGFRNLLALRAEIEGGTPGAPVKYVDLSYYDRALKRLKQP